MDHVLKCQRCGDTVSPGSYPTGCPACAADGAAGRLEVAYDFDQIDVAGLPFETGAGPASMWRYRDLLPLLRDDPVTLGEGWTPVVDAPDLSADTGTRVVLKNETVNPTWSFKDRLNSLLLSNATALGERYIATSSTGNHGASTAAYAARAGAAAVIVLLPPETEPPLRSQIRAYGADVVVTETEQRRPLLLELVDLGWYPTVSVTREYASLAYAYEAYKTIAFELVEQLDRVPDAMCVPVGAGDGLYGTWKGFRELHALGVIDRTPRMIGVQPAERPSLVEAYEAGADDVGTAPGPMPITTSTSGPSAGKHALRAIRESNGAAVAVTEDGVLAAMRAAGRAGVVVEPASALGPGAIPIAQDQGIIDPGDLVVCTATGCGVKWPRILETAVGETPVIDPDLDALAAATTADLNAPTGGNA